MKQNDQVLEMVFLKPGELFISKRPALIQTVLGSCVSVTMFNRRAGVGAICHAQLPQKKPRGRCNSNCPVLCGMHNSSKEAFKYADCAICFMHKRFGKLGIKAGEIEVKLFGGADVLQAGARSDMTIGRQNIEKALQVIEEERLVLAASSVGGKRGRKIYFYTHTGEILLKYIRKREVLNAFTPPAKTFKQRGASL